MKKIAVLLLCMMALFMTVTVPVKAASYENDDTRALTVDVNVTGTKTISETGLSASVTCRTTGSVTKTTDIYGNITYNHKTLYSKSEKTVIPWVQYI